MADRMRRGAFAVGVVLLLSLPVRAVEVGQAEGHVTIDGSPVRLLFAYGKMDKSVRPGAVQDYLILITNRPLAAATVNNEWELSRMSRARDLVSLEIRLDERFQHVRTVLWGPSPDNLLGSVVDFKPDIASRRFIAGSAGYRGEHAFSVAFRTRIGDSEYAPNPAAAAALPAAAPSTPAASAPDAQTSPGTPLPEGGGEPGRVYLAYKSAFRKGEIAEMKKFITREAAAQIDRARDFLAMGRALLPVNIHVVSGSVSGSSATLQVGGTPVVKGQGSSGTVTLVKEGTEWKVSGENWPAGGPNDKPIEMSPEQARAAQPVVNGTALPADGAAAGIAWKAYDAAITKGDAEALKKAVVAAAVPLVTSDIVQSVKALRPTNVHVVGGVISGTKATLRLEGTPKFTDASKGTATLVDENGTWKVAGEDWSTPQKKP